VKLLKVEHNTTLGARYTAGTRAQCLALSEARVYMQVLSAVRFGITAVCVLNVGGCGTATSVDATNLDAQNYQSSAADYRKCVAAYPNDPKVCEGRRLIMETNQRALNMMTTPVSDTMAKRP
jgi:hypothetical protein